MKSYKVTAIMFVIGITLLFTACGTGESTDSSKEVKTEKKEVVETDPMKDVGIGPISSLTLPPEIDQAMADKGKEVYDLMCTACHRAEKKFIGPSPTGIFERRNPAWVMNMILNPEEMVEKNPAARALLIEYNGSPMANQNLTEDEARAVLEYFRTL